MTKVRETEPMRGVPDIFLETLRKSLEHIADTVWLEKNSPLSSVFFATPQNGHVFSSKLQLAGRPDVDQRLRDIWRDWEALEKSPLQALVWQAIGCVQGDLDHLTQSILLLSYFDLSQPKQSQVIKLLAVGRSSYYRYLEKAVATLGFEIVKNLRPSLRLEQPRPRPLVGRQAAFDHALHQLQNGHVVHLIGGSGLGKTSLGALLADNWAHSVFWYTFRPKLTDSLEQLLFALAFFLHEQGASGLWLYLSSTNEPIKPDRALMALRQHLAELNTTPPLFCIDEMSHLLPDDLNDSETHIQLREFLEEWAHLDRNGSPILTIGHQLLLEPEPDCVVSLSQLTQDDIVQFMENDGVNVDLTEAEKLCKLTRGNPLLVRLLAVLNQEGVTIAESTNELTSMMTLDWFWRKLRQRLNETEQVVLQELSVFPNSAPKDGWRKHRKTIDKLISLGILEETGSDTIGFHPALRQLVYDQLPQSLMRSLHLGAGQMLAERSQFTMAAYHFVKGDRPDLAIWTLYTHRQEEIDQGQGSFALSFLTGIAERELASTQDRKALALLIAQLSGPAGAATVGLNALQSINWPDGKVSSALAHEKRGWLLFEIGETEQAIEEYRKSLESIDNLRLTEEIALRTHIARRSFLYQRDITVASAEVTLAKFDLDVLQGQLADAAGDYNTARIHYANALAVADQVANPSRLAKLHEVLGVMEARYAHVEAAVDHFKKAGQYHQACGNIVYAIGVMNINISFTYLSKRKYAEALEPGETALEYYQSIGQQHGLSIVEANLAEITFYLGRFVESRHYAESGLKREEPWVRPYCLYVLGHLSRVEADFEAAEKYCTDAIQSALEIEDPWAEAPARNALGEVYRDAGRPEDALDAFQSALAIWKRIDIQHEVEHTQTLVDSL